MFLLNPAKLWVDQGKTAIVLVYLSSPVLLGAKDEVLSKCVNLPKVSFSPESGGSVKPRSAIEEMRTQGTIRLKK